jgi:hypothetical protein
MAQLWAFLGSFMVPLSHQKNLVAQLMDFFESILNNFWPFEPPKKIDGSTLGLFWDLFVAQLTIFFESIL